MCYTVGNVSNKALDGYPRLLLKGLGLQITTTPAYHGNKVKMKTCLD